MKPERCSKCGFEMSPLMLTDGKCEPCRMQPVKFLEPCVPTQPKPLCACGCGVRVLTWKARYYSVKCRIAAMTIQRPCLCGCGQQCLRGRKYFSDACKSRVNAKRIRDTYTKTILEKAKGDPRELTLRERRALRSLIRRGIASAPSTHQSE